jgi:capsular polysaccharide export protein
MKTSISRHFLFLQGMPCDFFRRVGDALEERGHRVSRINLCFADWLFWHDHRAVNYRGRLPAWEGFLREFVLNHAVTDLVLLGEQRKYHKQAVALAQSLGLRVMATDFGYFRPDWITLEPNGMGEQSTMPKDPAVIRRLAVGLDEVDFTPRYRDSSVRMSLGDLAGSLGNVLFRPFYPHYQQSDERPHPFVYFPAMGLSLIRKSMRAREVERKLECVLRSNRPFFVFPLQLDHDFQIRAYSPFRGMDEAIDRVLESFARHAPQECELVVKTHPWDPGMLRWGDLIERKARVLGVSGRIHYLDGGSLDDMMAKSRGVVTINSTSGLKALQLNRPVQVLGSAVYAIEGLTNASGLDAFWTDPDQPDVQLLDAFIRLLVDRTQVRGVFFDPEGKRSAQSQFVNRLVGMSRC